MKERYAAEATVHRWLNTAVEKGFLKEKDR